MSKKEIIGKYGEPAYEKYVKGIGEWKLRNPTWVQENSRKWNRKTGKYYEKKRRYHMNGLPHAKELIRRMHAHRYRPYKRIIAPNSQLHHEWIPGTADYKGLALVEADNHIHGFVDVIQILEGEITLLTEAEIRGDK